MHVWRGGIGACVEEMCGGDRYMCGGCGGIGACVEGQVHVWRVWRG